MRPAPIEPPPAGVPGPQPPLVLDLPVLLTPFGIWLARRLALAAQVWLPSVFPRLIEESADSEEHVLAQLGRSLGHRDPRQLERNLESWRRAWPDITQTPRIYWFADALDNSRAPKGLPPASLDRLDELRSGLGARVASGEPVPVEVCDPVLEGGADALAVAAMLALERALIVSAPTPGRLEPAVCRTLDRHRIPCHQLEAGRHRELLLSAVLPTLHGAQVLSLIASGALRLAIVHLVAPEAMRPLPAARPAAGSRSLGDDEPAESALELVAASDDEISLWEGAMALWHDIAWQ
jgi:hypothetical protein